MKKDKVIVIIPAYNAGKTIEKVCRKIPKKYVDEICVVNDGSRDDTLQVIKKIGVSYRVHNKNMGYGASQKTGYQYALKSNAGIIIVLHADGQHDSRFIPTLLTYMNNNSYDMVLGSRIKNSLQALADGMPWYKVLSNRCLSRVANIVLGLTLSEHHTGFRVVRRKVLKEINFGRLSDGYVFDQEFIVSARHHNIRIGQIFTSCIYTAEASSINFFTSIRYGIDVLKSLFVYLVNKKQVV